MASVTFWRYVVPVEPEDQFSGWAIVFVDSLGTFSSVGDYGNFGHKWPSNGFGECFRTFLLGCDADYIRRKLCHDTDYDGRATCAAIKEEILRARRAGGMTRERAREEWDLLAKHDDVYSEYDLILWSQNSTIDPSEISRRAPPPGVLAFCTKTLPRLKDLIRSQLEQEAAERRLHLRPVPAV